MFVAKDLTLSIELKTEGEKEWISLKLADDLNLAEALTVYPLTPFPTNDRRYHLREALVIGMRRLMAEAEAQGMISGYPGTHWIWNTSPTKAPLPTTLLTELEL